MNSGTITQLAFALIGIWAVLLIWVAVQFLKGHHFTITLTRREDPPAGDHIPCRSIYADMEPEAPVTCFLKCVRCGRLAPETAHLIPEARLCRRCLGQEETPQ